MNLTENAALTNGNASIKVQTEIHSLVIRCSATTGNASTDAALLALLDNTKISITKNTASGEQVRINERPLREIIEISSALQNNAEIYTQGGSRHLIFELPLAPKGNIRLLTDEFLTIRLLSIHANVSILVHGREEFQNAVKEYEFQVVKSTADSPVDVAVDNSDRVAVPVSTFKRITFKTFDKSVVKEPLEIEAICKGENPLATLKTGLVTAGFENYFVLDTTRYNRVRHECTADTSIVLLKTILN